jgi:predicted MPP superfamily phosphohydrolase
VPSRCGDRLAYGHVFINCDVVVSGGLGCSIPPFRFGVPPEIVLVTVGAAPALS